MAEYTNDMFGLQQLMRDEEAAKEQSYLTNAVNLASTPGAGMMMRAQGIGRREGEAFAGLGRMLTGEQEAVDPRVLRMQKLQAIQQKFPEPETIADYQKLVGVFNRAGLPGEAQKAQEMVNSIRSSMPQKPTSYQEYTLTTTEPSPAGYAEYLSLTSNKGNAPTGVEASLALFRTTKDYLAAKTPKKQLELETQHIKAFNALNDVPVQDYASEIAGYMEMLNPATNEKYTNAEATTLAQQRQRETTEEVLDKEEGKLNLQYMASFQEATEDDAYNASVEIQGLENIISAYKNGGATGKLASTMSTLQGYLKDFGFEMDDNKLANTEVLIAEFASIALKRMGQLSGSASDNDIVFVKEGAASIDKTKGANMLLVDMALFYAKEKQQQAAFLGDFISTFEGTPTQNQISKAMRAFKNRGDTSEKAMKKYGKVWGSEEERQALVDIYGTNQYDRKGQLEKLSNIEVDADAIEIEVEDLKTLDLFLDSLD